MIASERLYWNSNRTKIVRENDSEAAFLFVAKGSEIPKQFEAQVQGDLKTPEPKDEIEQRNTRVVGKTAKR